MPCFYPLKGWRSKKVSENGKRPIVFQLSQAYNDLPISVPCGRCIGCRLERSRVWAIRCMHEASLYEHNCFITLTYAPEHLPEGGTLQKKHFQDFMKRLRKEYSHKIRFFHCGEYGANTGRPHYHAILFNHHFEDQELWRINDHDQPVYISETLQRLWPFGFNTIGSVTFESCAYVARYITKKVTGDQALEHYNTIDKETGEILNEKLPEYCTMSRRPGIAYDWIKKYKSDCYPKDYFTLNGRKMQPPKYYDSFYEHIDPKGMFKIKNRREENRKRHEADNTDERLEQREAVKLAQSQTLKRKAENA